MGPDQLSSYAARRLAPAELLAADDHLASCAICRDSLAAVDPPETANAAARDHLTYEELAEFVAGEATDTARTRAMAHLETCSDCSEAADDLRQFAQGMSAGVSEFRPSPVLKPARASLFSRAPWLPALCGAAGAAAVVFTVGVVPAQREAEHVITTQRSSVASLQAQLASAQRERDNSRSAAIAATVKATALQRQITALESKPATTPGPTQLASVPPQVTVAYRDGDTTIGVDHTGRIVELSSAPVTSAARLAKQLEQSPRGGFAVRGRSSAKPLSPSGLIDTDLPTFTWSDALSTGPFLVRVSDAQGHPVAQTVVAKGHRWQPRQPLPRGTELAWSVTTETIPTQGAETRFAILDQKSHRHLATLEQRHEGDPLAVGIAYAQYGLKAKASKSLGEYLETHPSDNGVFALKKSLDSKSGL